VRQSHNNDNNNKNRKEILRYNNNYNIHYICSTL